MFDVHNNKQLASNIPSSWAHFVLGGIYLDGTNVDGCVPDGLENRFWHERPLVPCSSVSLEAAAFVKLKQMVEAPGINVGPGLSSWTKGGHSAFPT
jgi:hypothetical protein